MKRRFCKGAERGSVFWIERGEVEPERSHFFHCAASGRHGMTFAEIVAGIVSRVVKRVVNADAGSGGKREWNREALTVSP